MSRPSVRQAGVFVFAVLAAATLAAGTGRLVWGADPAAAKAKPHRLPSADLKPVIWSTTCDAPDGGGLTFGGQDQSAEDGVGHTQTRENGQWKPIVADLRARDPLAAARKAWQNAVEAQKVVLAHARRAYFDGAPADRQRAVARDDLLPLQRAVAAALGPADRAPPGLPDYDAGQLKRATDRLASLRPRLAAVEAGLGDGVTPTLFHDMWAVQVELEKAAESLDVEPPPRALCAMAYDAKSKLYVLFAGDHCDYLTNDTWTFDPAARRWEQRHPPAAPPPRASHQLTAGDDGRVKLTGGYTYANNTDYMGGQYVDLNDGDWTYDVAADRWTGPDTAKAVPVDSRTYRAGPFHPDYYLAGPAPDAAAFAERLRTLPANTWVSLKPPHLPQMNRDWGTAVLDPDHDLILRFSGGHCAHGGTDVIHFHLATGQWELPFPVEFPLGQLYTNTEYPQGFNFNRRPWVTGHTYQSYGYGPSKQMLFTGQSRFTYVYDPERADWTGRAAKPKSMTHGDCFYDLTICRTPGGLACWTKEGELLLCDGRPFEWKRLPTTGAKLPGSVVDNSTMVYDPKRDRLLMARKGYGEKNGYDGRLYAVALKTGEASELSPANRAAAAAVPYLCQMRYGTGDLLLVGGTLPPDDTGLRRTPAYDCAGDRWVSLRITGDDPSGKSGRNVSLGMMYDDGRGVFWAVDTKSNVFVLRLDPATADVREMK